MYICIHIHIYIYVYMYMYVIVCIHIYIYIERESTVVNYSLMGLMGTLCYVSLEMAIALDPILFLS